MLNNPLVESHVKSSNIGSYILSDDDAKSVICANRDYQGESLENDEDKKSQLDLEGIANVGEFEQCLELSCGNGFLFRWLETNEIINGYVGIDISERQLQSFKESLLNQEQAGLVCGSVTNIPCSDEAFDLVIGHSFLHHIHNVPACLREVYRVLGKDGVFILTHEPSYTAPFYECFPVGLYKDPRTPSLEDIWLFTIDDLMRLLSKAGFHNVEFYSKGIVVNLVNGIVRVIGKIFPGYSPNKSAVFFSIAKKIDRFVSVIHKKSQPSISVYARK